MSVSGEEKVITCGACFQTLTDPIRLPCKDLFCSGCVQAQLHANGDAGFNCLLCGQHHSEVQLASLDHNRDKSLAEYIQKLTTGKYTGPSCEWCDTEKATTQCVACRCVYCEACSTAVHRNAAKREHAPTAITDSFKTFTRRCHERGHEEYKAEFYCTDCNQLCCAYCLQVGPHKDHRNNSVAQAASELRQQMPRDVQFLSQNKSRLEAQASELKRVSGVYNTSYDSVENMITERFNAFRQQLVQRELEVRKMLMTLRDSGDVALSQARKEFLTSLNSVSSGLLHFRALQNGGADYELLENRSRLMNSLDPQIPSVTGTGFTLASIGDMKVAGIDVRLDLHCSALDTSKVYIADQRAVQQQQQQQQRVSPVSAKNVGFGSPPPLPLVTYAAHNAPQTVARQAPSNVVLAELIEMPLRLTFPVDDNVEACVLPEGVQLQCVARGSGNMQIGVRSRELFDAIVAKFPEDNNLVTWQVRLDSISDSFLGIVERAGGRSAVPEGFYWKPACANVTDGKLGRHTSAARRLPLCRNGSVVRFVYDSREMTLRVICDDTDDRGVILADLSPRIAACFILYPGEALTVLF